jgi:hypothetical protein
MIKRFKSSRPTYTSMFLSFFFLLLLFSCQDNSTNPKIIDKTGPTIVSVSPAGGTTNQPISQDISVTFSETISETSINANTFFIEPTVSCTISFSNENRTVTFAPSTDLDYSTTYTVTLKTEIQDVAGNPMENDYSWQFTTEDAPIPAFTYPLDNGKRWLYEVYRKTGFVSFQGSDETIFNGDFAVYVADNSIQWQGRTAAALDIAELGDAGEFDLYSVVLFQGTNGVDMWTSGGWRTILSTQLLSFSNNAFLFSGTLANPEPSQLSAVQVTVPAGTYFALKTHYYFSETGPYAPQDIWDERSEYFVDGVGVVASFWDILIDDNDPMAADYYREGTVELKYIDSGPIPSLFHETEPNDVFLDSSNTFPMPAIIFADADLNDQGSIVGGLIGNYISPNTNGERIINDWYRVNATSNSPVFINLKFTGSNNDLDLYIYERWQYQGNNYSQWFGKSTLEAGNSETVAGTFTAGHEYFIGIQAWETPDGRADYWLCIRGTGSENIDKVQQRQITVKQK